MTSHFGLRSLKVSEHTPGNERGRIYRTGIVDLVELYVNIGESSIL